MAATFKKFELIVASVASIITFGVILAIHSQQKEQAYVHAANEALLSLPTPETSTHTHLQAKQENWETVTIRPGDTLERIFAKLDIPHKNLRTLLQLKNPQLSRLTPGKKFKFLLDPNHNLKALELPLSISSTLVFTRTPQGFSQKEIKQPLTSNLSFKSGEVKHSLIGSMLASGISSKLSHKFVNIFRSRVDFRHDIHPGDRFSILYKEYYVNGTKHHTGEIAAAEIVTHHKAYQAINFNYPKGQSNYYTPSGESLAHRFLPYPVKFKRVSSHFSYSRLDPIIHKMQAHLGVDFAAKRGTPIKSIGNGRITYIGRNRGYGNAIRVRYDRHYTALYAHMKRFASNLKLHQYVRRGQTIGYVGSTGWSTGPHLHFSFYVNGSAQDWLKLKPPYEPSIPFYHKFKFKKSSKTLLATLQLHKATALAENYK